MQGEGEISIGGTWHKVKAGDAAYVPRWTMHQSHNTGPTEMTILGITDMYLISRVQTGGSSQAHIAKVAALRGEGAEDAD